MAVFAIILIMAVLVSASFFLLVTTSAWLFEFFGGYPYKATGEVTGAGVFILLMLSLIITIMTRGSK